MPIESANYYLPKNKRLIDTFSLAKMWHFTLGATLASIERAPFEKAAQAASDYFTTGVAYFANLGHDKYMQDLGYLTWRVVTEWSDRVKIICANNMLAAMSYLGFSQDLIDRMYQGDHMYVLLGERSTETTPIDVAVVLIPLQFIVNVHNDPLEALGTVAWASSQLRDFANGRHRIDTEYISSRAKATEAHFLYYASNQHPEIEFSATARQRMLEYPQGIRSLSNNMKYQDIF